MFWEKIDQVGICGGFELKNLNCLQFADYYNIPWLLFKICITHYITYQSLYTTNFLSIDSQGTTHMNIHITNPKW